MIAHRRLEVWQRARRLSVAVLSDADLDRSAAARSLAGQLRRAVVSVAANVAEGAGSPSHAAFARYLAIGLASAQEADALLRIGVDARIVPAPRAEAWIRELVEIRAMLFALRRAVLRDPRGRSSRASRN